MRPCRTGASRPARRHGPPGSLGSARVGAACLLLCCGLVVAAVAQEKPEFLSADRQEQQRLVQEQGERVGKSLARIRIFRVLEVRLPDGKLFTRREQQAGETTGLAIAPGPMLMVSASAPFVGGAVAAPRGFRNPNLSEQRYALELPGGLSVPLERVAAIDAINMLVLRPAAGVELPAELPEPVDLEHARRPRAGEMTGTIWFVPVGRTHKITTLAATLTPGKERYYRPVVAFGGGRIGSPVIAADGELLGVLNVPSPEDRPDGSGERDLPEGLIEDPHAYTPGGQPIPVLMAGDEVRPLVRDLLRRLADSNDYALFGLRLEGDGRRLWVASVQAGQPAEQAGLLPGDEVRALAGQAVTTVLEFDAALERGFESDPIDLTITVSRANQLLELSLSP